MALPSLLTSSPQVCPRKASARAPRGPRAASAVVGTAQVYLVGFLSGVAAMGAVMLASWGVPAVPPQKLAAASPNHLRGSMSLDIAATEIEPLGLASENVTTDMKSLQLDVYGLPSEFLDSTERVNELIEAAIRSMANIKVMQKMTYHFRPTGLTSLWLLSASHASVHTWPAEGFAAIDFLTCGSADLAHVATVVEGLLREVSRDAVIQYGLSERGQGPAPRIVNDLAVQLTSMQQQKTRVHHVKSKYQNIEVWDVQGHSWVDGPHEQTSRRLYLDGVLQLASDDEDVYHESLVHPAMLSHKGPEHVVIMGGGDGGALGCALHHRSVKSVRVVEIDGSVVQVGKDLFPKFAEGFYDPRTEVVLTDAFRWIADLAQSRPSSVDALFFDLLDINIPSPLLDMLFDGGRLSGFISQTREVLRGDGVAVFQLGEESVRIEGEACSSVNGSDPDCVGTLRQHGLVQALKQEFEMVFVYSQFVPSFLGNWLFAVATNDASLAQRWGRPAAQVDEEVSQRLFRQGTLSFFSGSAMQRLRPRSVEKPPEVIQHFELSVERPLQVECPGLVPSRNKSAYQGYQIPYMLAKSQQAYGTGVFTLRPIRRGEMIWRWHDESFREVTAENWGDVVEGHPYAQENGVKSFLEKDWVNEYLVPDEKNEGELVTKMFLQLDDARFTNHGYTHSDTDAFLSVASDKGASEAPDEWRTGRAIVATRDIQACEEIFEDYGSYRHDVIGDESVESTPEWWEDVLASYGLTNQLYFPPGPSDFPDWAWLGGSANSD